MKPKDPAMSPGNPDFVNGRAPRTEPCDMCQGTGNGHNTPGSMRDGIIGATICPACNGTGRKENAPMDSLIERLLNQPKVCAPDTMPCKQCAGSGSVPDPRVSTTAYKICPSCSGSGREPEKATESPRRFTINGDAYEMPPTDAAKVLNLAKTLNVLKETRPHLFSPGRWACLECGVRDSRDGHIDGCSRKKALPPPYATDDWVEYYDSYHEVRHGLIVSVRQNGARVQIRDCSTTYGYYDCHHKNTVIRKIPPDMVIFRVGVLSGRVRRAQNQRRFILHHSDTNYCDYSVILYEALDFDARALLERLLAAQERG